MFPVITPFDYVFKPTLQPALNFAVALVLLLSALCSQAAGTLNLADFAEYLHDPDQQLRVESFSDPTQIVNFSPLTQARKISVYSNAAHWFRLSPPPGEWLLEVAYPLLDQVTFYHPMGDGGFDESHAGDTHRFSDREIPYHHPVFRLNQAGNDTFYLRVQTEGSAQMPLLLWSPSEFTQAAVKTGQHVGLYLGAMLAMVLYNLFLYLSIRDKNYLYYVIYISTFLLFQGSLSGYTFQYLWPESPAWGSKAAVFFAGLVVLAAVQFSRHFLETWQQAPRLDFLMWLLIGSGVLCMLLVFIAPYTGAALFANSIGVAMVLVVLPTGYFVLYRGYRPARFFVIAWSTFLVGILSNGLMLAGIVPHNAFTVNAMPAGSLIEVILLSLALADRISRLRQEKDLAQANFNQELQRINQTLELQVERRTKELSQAKERAEDVSHALATKNRELAEMASHDMLTELLNRRAFREQAELMLADGARNNYPLSLLMVDLDCFKQINDKYRHQAGDQVLVNVGRLLRQCSRTSDQVARYGGEEFILLLSHTDLDGAMKKAEQLRQAVADCRFVSFTGLKLSASFGVSSSDSGVTDLDELISKSDVALYEAKHCGRNRVCKAS